MQRGDGRYRRAENCETAVNKGHHNVAIRSDAVAFSPKLFLHLYKFFKLCSSKLWLFLEFDCLKYHNGSGKVRKLFYEKILDTTILTVYNYGKDSCLQLRISLPKGYG